MYCIIKGSRKGARTRRDSGILDKVEHGIEWRADAMSTELCDTDTSFSSIVVCLVCLQELSLQELNQLVV